MPDLGDLTYIAPSQGSNTTPVGKAPTTHGRSGSVSHTNQNGKIPVPNSGQAPVKPSKPFSQPMQKGK